MLEKYEVCCDLFHGFDYSGWIDGTPAERVSLLPGAQEHILAQENGKERCLRAVRQLSQAFALAVPHEEAMRIRDDVAFFQAVRSVLAKRAGVTRVPRKSWTTPFARSSRAPSLRRASSTSSPQPALRNPTSRSCPRSSSPKCGHEAAQLGGRIAVETAQGGTGRPQAKERRPGAIVRRDA